MLKGTVKFFNETKGFGFIVDNASGQEIFVHVSGLVDKIREGDTVTFETKQGKKGMNAVNVQVAWAIRDIVSIKCQNSGGAVRRSFFVSVRRLIFEQKNGCW